MRTETEQIYKERILRVLIHIQTHLDEPLSLEDLAAIAYFSPFHFHRIFKGMVGEPVKAHIRRIRLERSAWHLRSTDRNILDIALDAGYETHESFTRAFRSMFSNNPSVFRRGQFGEYNKRSPSGVHFQPGGKLENFNPITRGGVIMEIRIEKIEPMRVASVRHIGPYEECEPAWQKLCAWAGPRGLFGPGVKMIGISYDDPEVTPTEKIRYDACITVGDAIESEGEVVVRMIPGGDYAVATHKGPFTKLIETYNKFYGEWAPQSGRVVKKAACFEIYLNDPDRTSPEELLTDIYIPLEAE